MGKILPTTYCLFTFFLLSFTNIAKSETVYTFSTGEFAPYVSKTMKDGGVLVDLVRIIAKNMGIKVKIKFMPCTHLS